MRRLTRYALALVISGAITVFAATLTDSALLLAGIGQVYAVGSAVVLRPDIRRLASASGGTPSTVFVAVTVFGVLSIAEGLSSDYHFGAAILAGGLAYFGLVCGIWTISDGKTDAGTT